MTPNRSGAPQPYDSRMNYRPDTVVPSINGPSAPTVGELASNQALVLVAAPTHLPWAARTGLLLGMAAARDEYQPAGNLGKVLARIPVVKFVAELALDDPRRYTDYEAVTGARNVGQKLKGFVQATFDGAQVQQPSDPTSHTSEHNQGPAEHGLNIAEALVHAGVQVYAGFRGGYAAGPNADVTVARAAMESHAAYEVTQLSREEEMKFVAARVRLVGQTVLLAATDRATNALGWLHRRALNVQLAHAAMPASQGQESLSVFQRVQQFGHFVINTAASTAANMLDRWHEGVIAAQTDLHDEQIGSAQEAQAILDAHRHPTIPAP